MHLNKLAVAVLRSLLITGCHRAAGTDHRIGRLAKDESRSTARDDHRIGSKGLQLERTQVHRDEPTTHLMVVEHQRHHLPTLVLLYLAGDFKPADLFIECVKKLLTRRCARESSAVVLGPAKPAEIK